MLKSKRVIMRYGFIFSILIGVFSSQAQQILTLSDALKIALENNYSIQLSKNDAQIAKNNNYVGGAGMLPVVTGTALQDNTVTDTKQAFLNGTDNNKSGAKSNQLSANVELGWTIFDGFKMFATKNRLKELQDIGELKMRSQIEQTFARVMRSYFDVVQAKQVLNVNKETVKISEDRLKLSKDRFDAGKASKTEVLQAQVDLNTDKSLLMRQENQLKNNKVTLNQLLGRDVSVDFDVPATIETNTELKLDDVRTKMKSQNTSVLIAKKNQKISAFSLNEIRAERMPTIQLKTGYNYNKQESEAGFLQSSQTNGYHYGAGLSMNLFNGFSVTKRLQNAQLNMKSTDLVLKDTLSRIEVSLQQTYNSYIMSLQLLQFENENVTVAKSNFELANEQYKVGVISSLDLRVAQQNLLASESRLSTAQYEAKLAETDLMRLSGELLIIK